LNESKGFKLFFIFLLILCFINIPHVKAQAITYNEEFQSWQPSSTGWNDYNATANLGVPKGASMEVLLTHSDANTAIGLGVRTDGSSLARFMILHEAEQGGQASAVMRVKVDSSTGLIEIYCSQTTEVDFYLLDYIEGVDFTERFDQMEPSSQATWSNTSLSGYGVPANATTQFLMSNTDPNWYCDLGVREVGSSLSRLIRVHEPEGGGNTTYTNYVKADNSSQIQLYHQYLSTPDRYSYLLGYFGSSIDYVELWTEISDSTDGAFEDQDLSAYLDQDGRVINMLVFNEETTAENNIGVRGGDSSASRYFDEHEAESNGITGDTFTALTNSTGYVSTYSEDASTTEMRLAGYFIFASITEFQRSASQGITFSPTSSRIYGALRSATQGITAGYDASKVYNAIRSATQGITFSPTSSRIYGALRSATQGITAGYDASRLLTMSRSGSLGITAGYDASRLVSYIRSATQGIGAGFDASRIKGLIRSASQNMGFSYTATRLVNVIRSATQGITAGYDASRLLTMSRSGSLGITAGYDASKVYNAIRSATQGLSFGFDTSRLVSYIRSATQGIGAGFDAVGSASKLYQRAASIALSLSTSASRQVDYIRIALQGFSFEFNERFQPLEGITEITETVLLPIIPFGLLISIIMLYLNQR
jgi:hypothetical protein